MRSIARSSVALSRGLIASDRAATTFAMKGVRKGHFHKQARLSIAAALLMLTMAARAQQQPMEELGTLRDVFWSSAAAVSADGTVIVGYNITTAGLHAFRYDAVNGVTDLLTLNGGKTSFANSVSADGAVIVGHSTTPSGFYHAFRYANGQMTDIHNSQNGTSDYSYANAVSSDGKVIVGESGDSTNSTHYAFRYDANGIFTNLGNLGGLQSTAYGVSADGAVIVGSSSTGSGQQFHAFRYSNGMMTDLGTLGGTSSYARNVSGDGTVVVGYSQTTSLQFHAFRYSGGMMTDLGTLGGTYSIASGVSANGSVIVGASSVGDIGAGDTAIIHAFKVVGGVMTDLGTLGGPNSYANSVSANGAVIVGSSDTLIGLSHAFIYRNVMVDVPNTYAALGTNAGQLAGLLNVRQAVLGFALHDECNSYSVRNVCVSASGRSSRVEGGFADTGAQLQLGYRFSPQLRIGASLDQGISTSTPGNYTVNHSQPLVALYAAYAPTGSPTGLQLKVSVAQGSDDIGITRSLLANTEAGRGASSLTAKGVQLEAGWGWALGRWQAMSFAGVKDMRLSRAAYTETSGADFPVSYKKVRQSATTAYAGLQASSALATNLMVSLRGGVEQDLHRHQDGYAGTMEFLGPFAVAAPTVRRTRAFATVSGAYQITPMQQLSVGVHYSQQSLKDANDVTVIVRYSAAL